MPIANELNVDTSATAMDMANSMFGNGVTIQTASYTGAGTASGTYTGGQATLGSLTQSDTGVILSTGNTADFTNSSGTADTNTAAGTSTDHSGVGEVDGDTDLDAVSGQATQDGAFFDATFIATGDLLTMQFVFTSEEYLEYVNGGVNDAMGVWVNGTYVPLTLADGSNQNVTIDTINNTVTSNLYVDNAATDDTYNTEMDGGTVVLSLTAPVNAGASNTIRIGIGDGGDSEYDSNLLIMGDSIQTISIAQSDELVQGVGSTQVHDLLSNDINVDGNALTITHINNVAVNVGDTVTLPSGEQITLNADMTVSVLTDADIGTNNFTYSTVDTAGNPSTGFATIETTATPPNFIVEGTAGGDVIDSTYVTDPQGDLIDSNDHSDASNADSVLAGAGNDTIKSGQGDDTVQAGIGDDLVYADDGSDSVFGDAGQDTLSGGRGDDAVEGGSGDDQILGGEGVDTLSGDDGNDVILGDAIAVDLIAEASGVSANATTLTVENATDEPIDLVWINESGVPVTYYTLSPGEVYAQPTFEEHNWLLVDSDGNYLDLIHVADETFVSWDNNNGDDISGGAGNDTIDGMFGNDTISGGSGDDSIDGGSGDDSVFGSDGSDTIFGGAGDDTLDGDDAFATGGADSIDGGAGNDQIIGDVGNDSLYGGTGNDTVYAGSDDDLVYGEAGDDQLYGEAGNDYISGGDGNDLIVAGDGTDDIDGGDGNDTILGEAGGDNIDGDAGDDALYGGTGQDSIWGGTGNDTIDGGSENDALYGGAGDDSIIGGTGADFISLSGGADTVDAGDDADNIVMAPGSYADGTIVTIDGGTGGTDNDTLNLGTWDAYRNLTETTDADADSTSGSVEVQDASGNWITVNFSEIENLNLPATNLTPNYIVEGTAAGETIDVGYTGDPEGDMIDNSDHSDGSNDDSVQAGGGDDSVLSGLGDDSVDAGTGDDTVLAGAGNDSVLGDTGNDSISGESGDDTVRGGMGNDTIIGGAGNDSIDGNEDDDSIEGGAGSDTLRGEFGDDVVSGGDGDDTVEGNEGDDTLSGGAGNDWVRGSFGNDSITSDSGDDYIWGGFGDDTISYTDGFGDDTIEGEEANETDGDTIDLSGVTADLTVDLTSANPEAGTFTDGTDTVSFVEIENIILGGGDDTLVLGTGGGADTVEGFSIPTDVGGGTYVGNDVLDISSLLDTNGAPVNTDDVTLSTDANGDAVLTFPSGESLTLVGVTEASITDPDVLEAMGIPQPDYIVEGTAAGELIDGNYITDPEGDVIDGNDNQTAGNEDSVQAGAGDDTVFSYAGNDTIDAGAGNDSVDAGDADDVVIGGAGDDTLQGWFGDDSLEGGAGDDSLIGWTGDDTLIGGAGNDSIAGGDDQDLIVLEDGFGDDTIDGGDGGATDYDTLDMSAVTTDTTIDLTSSNPESGSVTSGADTATFADIENIVLGAGTDTVVLGNGSGGDIVDGFEAPTDNGDGTYTGHDQLDVSTMTDAGGNPVNVADVTVTDTNGDGTGDAILSFPNGENITLTGVSPSEVDSHDELEALGIPGLNYIVEGTAGADTIDSSYTGDPEGDLIDNGDMPDGSNDDSVLAGDGSDSVVSGLGDDTVWAGSGDDTVAGGAGEDLIYGQSGNDVLNGGGDNDTIDGGVGDDSIEGDIGEDSLTGGAGEDTVIGGAGDDWVSGGDDNDTVYGGEGNDSVFGAEGDDLMYGDAGDDSMEGWVGDDTMIGGAGDDYIDGADGVDSLSGGDGNDTLLGGNDVSDDTLIGGAGNDSMSAGEGDDSLDGGIGDDFQYGAGGDDTFVIGDNFGDDTITGGETGETDGDTLDMSSNTTGVTVDLSSANSETGTVNDGTSSAGFTEIENIVLGGGRDTIVLADGSGADTVDGFDLTDSGDGTTNDQLDVSGMTDAGGDPVNVHDVTVTDTNGDGTGDAILTFPNGESITLTGVSPTDVDGYDELVALGIPGTDEIVSGTSGSDTINVSYTGDPDGDMIDAGDNAAGNDDDVVQAGTGDDQVFSGAGDDTVDGGAGNDVLQTGLGDDYIIGGAGNDTIYSENGQDTVFAGDGDDVVGASIGADYVDGGAGNDSIDGGGFSGGAGDTLIGGDGDDTISGGGGADVLSGDAGNDVITVNENDTATGGDGDDLFEVALGTEPGTGSISITGGEGDETLGDTLDFNGLIGFGDITYTNTDPGVGGGMSGSATLSDGTVVTFDEIENVIICFTEGTRIATSRGAREVEDIAIGDLVVTRDHGLQPVRWAGKRTVPAQGSLAPIRFETGVLGNERPLYVSPQHRMLVQGHEASLLFGESEVLASAKHLVNGGSVTQAQGGEVTYVHILFDQHEVIYAEGSPSESFFPGGTGLDAVEDAAREELFSIFPELRSNHGGYGETARMCLKSHESRLLRLR